MRFQTRRIVPVGCALIFGAAISLVAPQPVNGAQETMEPAAYERDLERLLLAIARNGQAIREQGGGG